MSSFSSQILLYFSPIEVPKKEEIFNFNIFYLGNLYQTDISSHFGGQFILQEREIQNKYYILVSNQLELLFDHNNSIKGYKVDLAHVNNAKMYVMYLIISTNEKNNMSYNWKIEEMAVPKNLPDHTIIVYSNPENISFKAFDKKFDRAYPSSSQRAMIVLPQISFDPKGLLDEKLHDDLSIVNSSMGHIKITQSSLK
jgi:hypothetical protein